MENPWLSRRVLAYAHQGGAKEAPSSTLYAIERALRLGAIGIELDVHATKDGVLVVCHDATLDATTNGNGLIVEHGFVELRQLDNAYRFVSGEGARPELGDDSYLYRGRGPTDRRFGLASLDEVLTSFPEAILNLDIKQTAPTVAPYEEALARTIASYRRAKNVIVGSFHDSATAAFAAYAPAVSISAGINSTTAFTQAVRSGEVPAPDLGRFAALQVPPRFAGIEIVDARFVEVAHELGVAVHVWTIDDEAEMDRLVGLGVDGIMSDVPSVLVALLERHKLRWSPS